MKHKLFRFDDLVVNFNYVTYIKVEDGKIMLHFSNEVLCINFEDPSHCEKIFDSILNRWANDDLGSNSRWHSY